MEADLTARFAEDSIATDQITFTRSGDLRYVGQGYELKVPIDDGDLDDAALAAIWERFHDIHAAEYGHAFEANPIEVVNLRVTAISEQHKLDQLPPVASGSLQGALLGTRPSVFRANGQLQEFDTAVYQRDRLPVAQQFAGPAILLQKDSTTLVPPGATASVHPSGSIIITLKGRL